MIYDLPGGFKWFHLPPPRRLIDVGLIENEIPLGLLRRAEAVVEDVRALLHQNLESPAEVPMTRKPHHFHLVDDGVGPQNVVLSDRGLKKVHYNLQSIERRAVIG